MKAVICLCALVVVAIARPDDKRTSRYNNVNVKEFLGNQRLLHSYIKCGLGLGKCTNEAKEFINYWNDELESECATCTEKQKQDIRLVVGHLVKNEPDYWRQLSAKFDPLGKYAAKYEDELKAIS